MTHKISTIPFPVDTHEEADRLVRDILPHLYATRDDRVEISTTTRPVGLVCDGVEVTIYVIVHTGNLSGMMADLTEANIL